MSDPVPPTTVTRFFDPSVWGLRANQLRIFFACAILSALYLAVWRILLPGNTFIGVIGGLAVIASWVFFITVGLDRTRLYKFERRINFMLSRFNGEEQIRKYNKKDMRKVKNFSRIKRILKHGYTEFLPTSRKSHNWGIFLELYSCKPEDLDSFVANAERTLTGVPANTIIKTVLKARKTTGDAGEQYRKQLRKEGQIQILKDICFEQAMLCSGTPSKTYKTHMAFIIPYEPNEEEACRLLDNIANAVQKSLKEEVGIESRRLETEDEVLTMFSEMISKNVHLDKRFLA